MWKWHDRWGALALPMQFSFCSPWDQTWQPWQEEEARMQHLGRWESSESWPWHWNCLQGVRLKEKLQTVTEQEVTAAVGAAVNEFPSGALAFAPSGPECCISFSTSQPSQSHKLFRVRIFKAADCVMSPQWENNFRSVSKYLVTKAQLPKVNPRNTDSISTSDHSTIRGKEKNENMQVFLENKKLGSHKLKGCGISCAILSLQ